MGARSPFVASTESVQSRHPGALPQEPEHGQEEAAESQHDCQDDAKDHQDEPHQDRPPTSQLHALVTVPGPWGDPRDSFGHASGGIDCCIFLRRAWGSATAARTPTAGVAI